MPEARAIRISFALSHDYPANKTSNVSTYIRGSLPLSNCPPDDTTSNCPTDTNSERFPFRIPLVLPRNFRALCVSLPHPFRIPHDFRPIDVSFPQPFHASLPTPYHFPLHVPTNGTSNVCPLCSSDVSAQLSSLCISFRRANSLADVIAIKSSEHFAQSISNRKSDRSVRLRDCKFDDVE
jgi:hypothetical protein